MFESGVCFQDPKSVTPTTTMAGVTYSTIEVTLPLTVDDAAAILNNATVASAGFSGALEVTGKMTMRVPAPTTTTTTTTTTTEAGTTTTTTEGGDDGDAGDDGDDGDDGDEQPPSSAIAGSASAAVLGLAVALLA
eukprot:s3968_g3.t1